MSGAPALVLASASPTRARMLRAAGVDFDVAPAHVDEEAARDSLRAEGASAADAAMALAELKALRISAQRPEYLVVGADQILSLGARWFAKPPDRAAARAQLLALRGREHRLDSAACAAMGGAPVWRAADSARLSVRPFGDGFLDSYLDSCLEAGGGGALESVGAYRVEGPGAQLFSAIDGDYFTILGLPLLPLLEYLRQRGMLER